MTTTILRTVPCSVCGHRISPMTTKCEYCGHQPKPSATIAELQRARACPKCGGRMTRGRGVVARALARLGWRPRRLLRRSSVCVGCGHREQLRWS